jgi:hypothetical protein
VVLVVDVIMNKLVHELLCSSGKRTTTTMTTTNLLPGEGGRFVWTDDGDCGPGRAFQVWEDLSSRQQVFRTRFVTGGLWNEPTTGY